MRRRIATKNKIKDNGEFVIINGLKWDKHNLYVPENISAGIYNYNNITYMTFHTANSEAELIGKRLPTIEEYRELIKLGFTGDEVLEGLWFGEDHFLKRNSKNSIFFLAAGIITKDFYFSDMGVRGYYWTSSIESYDWGYSFRTILKSGAGPSTGINTSSSSYFLSVRCVQDI